jgi:hypothetical protein
MSKRGKVLREPIAGPGLLIAEGRQYQFGSDGIWKSQVSPKPGLVVEIELDAQGKMTAITAVSDLSLAKEQEEARAAGTLAVLADSGWARLLAAAVLAFSWFFLTAISIQVRYTGTLEITFWQLLRQPGSRGYALLALLAVTGPFAHYLWKIRQLALAGLLPLFFMLFSGVLLLGKVGMVMPNAGDALYQHFPAEARRLPIAISLGLGSYVSIVISLYFALLSARQFRMSKRNQDNEIGQLQKAAA